MVHLVTRVLVVVVDAETTAVAGVVPLPTAEVIAVKTPAAAVTTAVDHEPPTLGSQDKVQTLAKATEARHVASAAHKPHAHSVIISMKVSRASRASRVMKYSARTHAARGLTWASSATTLTNANPPAMCLQAFRHPACQRAALAAVAGVATAAVAVAAAVILEVAVRALAVVAGVTRAAGFGVD